jgi:Ca-activated chloride channel family protein
MTPGRRSRERAALAPLRDHRQVPRLTLCTAVPLLCVAALCLGWMNPTRDRIAEANRLFKQGKFDEAISKYGEALVDDPESPLLNFNMGDANYKAGKYAEAMASFGRVRATDEEPKRQARIAYNIGNAQYRLGAAAEANKPQDALQAYAGALVAYRRALGADPTDQDAKFNYEFVSKKIDDLKKKLEEQKQQKDQQQQQEQQQEQQQQAQQQQEQQRQDQQHAQNDQQPQQQPDQAEQQQQQQAQQEKSEDQQQKQQEQQQASQQPDSEKGGRAEEQAAQAAAAGGEKTDKMSGPEAAALIDTARNEELQPEEFARQAQGAAVAEPAQDW